MVKRTQVGSPMNFRGMMYKPINEQGVVYLFGLVAEDLNIIVESIQQGYPDCTGLKYVGKNRWERIRIEFEYKGSTFFSPPHDHDPKGCDIIVCWEDDLNQQQREILANENVEVIALKDRIDTDEIPNKELIDPETASKSKYDIEHHYKRRNVIDNVKRLFERLDGEIKKIDSEIWDKYSKTAITYYAPEKNFVYLKFRKSLIDLNIYTKEQTIEGVKNIKFHENWGNIKLRNDLDLVTVINAIRKSFELMKQAIKENINTGWYAVTPPEKLSWKTTADEDEDSELGDYEEYPEEDQ